MAEYKNNSFKAREKEEKTATVTVSKVVKGAVVTKKPGIGQKIKNTFISDDINNIKQYIICDVIVPSLKEMIITSIDMALNGGKRKTTATKNNAFASPIQVAYNSMFSGGLGKVTNAVTGSSSIGWNGDDILLASRGDAEEVLNQMQALIDVYKVVSVSQLYDLIGEVAPYTANKFGWTNIRNATVIHTKYGWKLNLPRPMALD